MTTNAAILADLPVASAAVGAVIDRLPVERWTSPTPCTEWTVRDVVHHLVGMNLVFTAMLEGGPMPDRGTDPLGDDPAEAYRHSAAALAAAAALPGVLETSQATPLGEATHAERLLWRIADLVVHGWDLEQATGVPAELPEDLLERSLTFVRAGLPGQARGGRFAPPQPVSDDAPVADRLASFTGRRVPWDR